MGKIVNLFDTLACSDESIASRILFEKENATVTLFSFARGQRISPHQALYHAMLVVLESEALLQADGSEHLLKSGSSAMLQPGETHGLYAATSFKMLLVMFKDQRKA